MPAGIVAEALCGANLDEVLRFAGLPHQARGRGREVEDLCTLYTRTLAFAARAPAGCRAYEGRLAEGLIIRRAAHASHQSHRDTEQTTFTFTFESYIPRKMLLPC